MKEYFSWVSVEQVEIEKLEEKSSSMTWLDSIIVCCMGQIEVKIIPEENLAYADFHDSKIFPILHGKKTPGKPKSRVYTDLFVPIDRSGYPMFTKIKFITFKKITLIYKFLLILKLLAKSTGSYSMIQKMSKHPQGREILCQRLTGAFI